MEFGIPPDMHPIAENLRERNVLRNHPIIVG
jgi:hypothetical protein